MKPVTSLFIRACKSKEPLKRCHSVYNRFYIRTDNKKRINVELAYILAKICDEQIGGLSHLDVLGITSTISVWCDVGLDLEEAIARMYIDKIRYMSIHNFKEVLPLPRKFRQ